MPGVCRNLCFDYREWYCLLCCYHGKYGLKNTLEWFLQRIITSMFDINIYRNGTKHL